MKVQPSPHLEKSSSPTQQIPKPSVDPPPPQAFHRPGSPFPLGNSPGPQDRLGSPGMQKQPPMCAPSSPGRGPWEHQPEEHWKRQPPSGVPPPASSLAHEGPSPAQSTMQPLISWLRQQAQGGWEGPPSPQDP